MNDSTCFKTAGCMALAVLLLPLAPVYADEAAQQQMAGVLMELNHFPTDADKASLQALAEDSSLTEAERILAGMLMTLRHMPSAEEKTQLQAIAGDEQAPQAVRDLAAVLHDLQHRVDAEGRETLAAILSSP